jgi:hypothetical protein
MCEFCLLGDKARLKIGVPLVVGPTPISLPSTLPIVPFEQRRFASSRRLIAFVSWESSLRSHAHGPWPIWHVEPLRSSPSLPQRVFLSSDFPPR